MMQVPTQPTTCARPAADLAVPGMRPSCAVEPRFGDAIDGGKDGRNALDTGRIHRIRQTGKFGRDRKDQRGRAVACA
jgi:hypothetical protein